MTADGPSRRTASALILVCLVVGFLVVLGWVLRAALFALGLALKLSGLVILAVIIFVLFRALSRRS